MSAKHGRVEQIRTHPWWFYDLVSQVAKGQVWVHPEWLLVEGRA